MHMWFWFGYQLDNFLFAPWEVKNVTSFVITCVFSFFLAFIFEGSKVYVATAQKNANRKLLPHRKSDESNNLLSTCPADAPRAGPSRDSQAVRRVSMTTKCLINLHQTLWYLVHNTIGFILMIAVMLYNFYLMIAVILGLTLGYFVFGPMITRLQMQCYAVKTSPRCTTECDEDAETSTPPLLHSTSETDYLICQTRSCVRQAYYQQTNENVDVISCQYGSKVCPSKLATIERSKHENQTQKEACCSKKFDEIGEMSESSQSSNCCKSTTESEIVHDLRDSDRLEESPRVYCCQQKKSTSESEEKIV